MVEFSAPVGTPPPGTGIPVPNAPTGEIELHGEYTLKAGDFLPAFEDRSGGHPPPPAPVVYTSFNGLALELVPWAGEQVAYLVPQQGFDDPGAMRFIVDAPDRAYERYELVTGREPTPYAPTTYQGLDTIAVVPETCGAGCGYLGFTGIEIQTAFAEEL